MGETWFPGAIAAAHDRLSAVERYPGPELQPLSLAGRGLGRVSTAACALAIVAIATLEVWKPGLASLGSLLFIPVLVSAWMLDDREAIVVSALAVAARLVGYSVASVDIGTAVAEVATLGALATMTRMAAVGLHAARERKARAARDSRLMDLIAERERIAAGLTDTAVRRLYGVTLELQAASVASDTDVALELNHAIGEIDTLTSEIRSLVFER